MHKFQHSRKLRGHDDSLRIKLKQWLDLRRINLCATLDRDL